MSTIYLAGGCFWCTEAIYKSLKGVSKVTPGYIGGTKENPTYEDVSSGLTGHAEAVKVEYNGKISIEDLLDIFLTTHDPTTLNKQGNDVGTQYRSAIFYTEESQKKIAEKIISKLANSMPLGKNVVTELRPASQFYPAEEYHRDYYFKNADNPYCSLVISPKLEKLKKNFGGLLQD